MEYKEAKLYPTPPAESSPEAEILIVEGSADSYRRVRVNGIQEGIPEERDKRANLSKKYHRAVKIIVGVDTALGVSSLGLRAAGIGVLSTIIAAPIVIAMEAAALGTGLLLIVGNQTNKKLSMKAENTNKVHSLTQS